MHTAAPATAQLPPPQAPVRPAPSQASILPVLLTGADPRRECGRAAHGEGGWARGLQRAPGKDVVGVGAGALLPTRDLRRGLKRGLGTVTCTPHPRQAGAPARLYCLGGRAAGAEAEGWECSSAEWTVVGWRWPLRGRTQLQAPLSLTGPSHPVPQGSAPVPQGPAPAGPPARAPHLSLPVKVGFLCEGGFTLEPHGLPRPAATALCSGGSIVGDRRLGAWPYS